MTCTRIVLALACWVMLLPHLATSAQDPSRWDTPAVQTVAHGVMAMPAETMVWQSELQRAVVPHRAIAEPQPGGFVLADTGALAITNADGRPLQHLAPGNATWIDPGATRAIVSLEGRSAGFLRISLIPASLIPDEPGAASHGEPFSAPPGMAELDLLRDILERGEEVTLAAGDTPALLQVTSGKVFVTLESGEISEVAEGSPLQFLGQVTVLGASRSPAAFVVARLGAPLPARVTLYDPAATPVASPGASPDATPVAIARGADLAVTAWLCPPGYDATAPLIACTIPAAGVRFTAEGEDGAVSLLTDDAGAVAFASLPPGLLQMTAHLPGEATTAVASCRDLRGDAIGRVRDDALRVMLAPGANITCGWFVDPGATWPAAALTVVALACPPAMAAAALHPEFCEPAPTGLALELQIEDAILAPVQTAEESWVWAPLLEPGYQLRLANLPAGFTSAVLDDGDTLQEGDAVHIFLEDDLAPLRTLYLLQPLTPDAADVDSDADGLPNADEVAAGSDPFIVDSDGDGLADGDETNFYGTDPLEADTDGDGLPDQEEVALFFTNPFLVDTDGDDVSDADEVAAQTDPLSMLSLPPTPTPEPTATPPPRTPTTTPSPTVVVGTPLAATPIGAETPVVAEARVPAVLPTLAPDASPVSHTLSPAATPDPSRAAAALDNDGLATLDEIAIYGTDPVRPDTDGDGMNDGDEVASGRDPRDPAR